MLKLLSTAYFSLQLKSIRMLGMVHLVAVHTKHLPFVREIRPGYCKTALLGLLVNNGSYNTTNNITNNNLFQSTLVCLCALNFSFTQEAFEIQPEKKILF